MLTFEYIEFSTFDSNFYHIFFANRVDLSFVSGLGFTKPYIDADGNAIRFIDSGKGKRQLTINSHIFTRMSHHGNVTYWR